LASSQALEYAPDLQEVVLEEEIITMVIAETGI
jgi:hypothetical protein